MSSRKALGRGLDALIPNYSSSSGKSLGDKLEIRLLNVSHIQSSRYQPRKLFNDEKLIELGESIKKDGFIQPIVVSRRGSQFELIAGERRWRASKLIGLKEIPAIVRTVKESKRLELALIENIQREDLNPIEIANSYRRLMLEFDITQEGLSEKINKSRSSIANSLRLLKLPDEIQADLIESRLTAGHARALLSIEGKEAQLAARDNILSQNLNVRAVEQRNRPKKKEIPVELTRIIELIEQRVGLKSSVDLNGLKGRLTIKFEGEEEFDHLLKLLGVK
ncbi:MAG: ParB/RepB/Spo0J family partition protein [Nitrospinota bacterium]